jgi:hypothetical protein
MPTQNVDQEVLADLLEGSNDLAVLAKDEKVFRQAYEAFRSGNGKQFQDILKRLKLIPRCSRVCHWIRTKECVFYCLHLCGIPKPQTRAPNPRVLAEAIVRITSDERLLKQLVEVLEKRDRDGFERIVVEHKLQSICHFFCHWLCVVRLRLMCRWVCTFPLIERPDLFIELQQAGYAIRQLLENKDSFEQAVAASDKGDSDRLHSVIASAGLLHFCHFVCEWFCSWRCTLVCFNLCREFAHERIHDEIEEAYEFAKAVKTLAQRPAEAERLIVALRTGDTKAWAAAVRELKLHRHCIQLCHWICGLRCRRFCFLVCPPVPTMPLFTHVGAYKITTDFAGDGTTNSGSLAFTGTIPLIGILPDGQAPDSLEYRFTYETYPLGGAPQPLVPGLIPASRIGSLQYKRWDAASSTWVFDSGDYWVNNPGATISIPQQFGPNLVVPVNVTVKPDGWIEVPRENSLFNGGVGRFIPNTGVMANLDTTQLTENSFDLTVAAPPLPLNAGDSVPVAQRAPKPLYKINCEAREVGTVLILNANSLTKIAMSNTSYKYVRHMNWAGYTADSVLVLSLNIAELLGGGCSPLAAELNAMYTAYHPYLGTCSVYLEGPGIPPPAAIAPAISADGEAVSAAEPFDISSLSPCAYIVWLTATLRLTSGYGAVYGTFNDHIAFCIR